MYKYGVVSIASITKRFIDGLRLAGDEVVCVGSRDIVKAKQYARENSIPKYYGSYEEVYEDKDVDIVYIPVINNLHYECAKEALLHKKHVVLEKPFVIKPEQAKELFELARNNNCLLFEGVKNLFVPSTEFVKNNLKRIGKVTHITTAQGTKKQFPEGHWMYDATKGGGAYAGSAAYVYHYLCYLFNCKTSNLDGSFVPSSKSDLVCSFNFNLNDIRVDSTIDLSMDLDNNCIIYGTNGKIIIHEFWRSHYVLVETNDGNKFEFDDDGNEFVYEVKHVQDCLNKGLIESPFVKEDDCIQEVSNIEYLYSKWGLI